MKISNTIKLIISIVVCEIAGVIGAFYTTPSILTWYSTLPKPALNPPSWVFGPVWTTLYLLMGISLFLIWREYEKTAYSNSRESIFKKIALGVFALQLLLNVIWSKLFFGEYNPGGAFIDLIFLWLAILVCIFMFRKISLPATWLLVPYILWVSFAGYLNYSIWQLSKNQPEPLPEQVFCTQDAMMCPDGSYVGRSGPQCQFVCPPENK